MSENEAGSAVTEYGVMRADGAVYAGMAEDEAFDMAQTTGWTVVSRTVSPWESVTAST